MLRYTISTVCLWLFAVSAFAAQNHIGGLRISPSADNTRIVLDLAQAPEFTYFSLTNPHRLVIDLAATDDSADLSTDDDTGKLVRRIRYSTPKNSQSARLVIDLTRDAKPNIFAIPPDGPYGHRLVVDLADSSPSGSSESSSGVLIDSVNNKRDRDIIIAIDAGHGGNDPGSIGPAGTYEKRITLSIAKELEALVNAEKGMRAVMIRSGDYYIYPTKRPEIARQKKADLLISIHADAFSQPEPRGGSVWVLSMRRADSELGRWLEKTERHSELLGGAAEVISDNASERYLAETILGLSMDHSMSASYALSQNVLSEMRTVTPLHKRAPQAASFAVLTAPDIPSILVEVGFISNPQEEKNLNWSTHRQRLARAMFNAAKSYFMQVPPDGTLWASLKERNRTHRVRSGESLSLLAQRYNVKVSSIKEANNLRTDVVRIGQVLTIPST
ncbi:AMIN domain-containing protein [Alteromonas pelagimontana]|uniref:N-acetylmuramoyl-L-alanine amidase n=1 Tax=Alteromonas pelagimontana TaxID=1858656 RepID=A0A6M4ME56_9ALTE|nr:N-acetylmuramoyl-L-alanine amidase [Alteromonas pelagimontana]QJR81382.1 AMIN domain-containing protein [Alteromonas pelagimontana]